MAITLDGTPQASSFSALSFTVTLPTGFTAGDVLVIAVATITNATVITPPSGYVSQKKQTGYATNGQLEIFTHVLAGGDTNPVFSLSVSAPGSWAAAAYIGAATSGGLPVFDGTATGQANTTASTTATSPSITLTQNTSRLLMCYGDGGKSIVTTPVSEGTIDIASISANGRPAVGIVGFNVSSSGATGAQTATLSVSFANAGIQLALKAAVVAPTPSLHFRVRQLFKRGYRSHLGLRNSIEVQQRTPSQTQVLKGRMRTFYKARLNRQDHSDPLLSSEPPKTFIVRKRFKGFYKARLNLRDSIEVGQVTPSISQVVKKPFKSFYKARLRTQDHADPLVQSESPKTFILKKPFKSFYKARLRTQPEVQVQQVTPSVSQVVGRRWPGHRGRIYPSRPSDLQVVVITPTPSVSLVIKSRFRGVYKARLNLHQARDVQATPPSPPDQTLVLRRRFRTGMKGKVILSQNTDKPVVTPAGGRIRRPEWREYNQLGGIGIDRR